VRIALARTTKSRAPTTRKGRATAPRAPAEARTRGGTREHGASETSPEAERDLDGTASDTADSDVEGAGQSDATVEDHGDGEPAEGGDEEPAEGEFGAESESLDNDAPAPSAAPPSSEAAASIERFDPLSAYLREVQKHPLLSAEETQSLAEKFVAAQDPRVAARLVTANLRLVVKIAYEYRRAYKNIMDLIQEGNIGLMQAVKRYDPYRGVKLSSYAAWWIRAYILRFILNNWRLVKLGTTQAQRKLFFNLRKKRAELQALGVDPSNAEIAKQLNVPESEVAEMDVRLQASEKSLDAPIGDGDGRATAKIDTMPSLVEGPEVLLADSELQGLLKEKLASFRETLAGKDKELAIFDERLVSDEPLTLQELGDRFGISRERVRQLEQRLTGRLRDFLRDEMGDAVT
jgi:RNA polymerase sigma-32 factor